MRTIHKYTINEYAPFSLKLPQGSIFLHVEMQRGHPVAWFEVEDGRETISRTFQVFGTGHQIPDDLWMYRGTYQDELEILVWHLYEKVVIE